MSDDKVVIVSAKRTPIGSFQGQFESIKATELGSRVIEKNISEIAINPQDIDETIMGCVLPAGLGQAPARQAAMGAGIPNKSGATTINKMCGSGMKSIMFAHDSIKAEQNNIVVAGGLENMTNAPYILSKARKGFRMGHADIKDHMFLDGLEDAYEEGKLMGSFAEDTAEHYQFTREQQDNFAINSLNRARKANDDGTFEKEIVPIKVLKKKK